MAQKKTMTYSQAMSRIEEIVGQMNQGDPDIDLLGQRVEEAVELLDFCRSKLEKAQVQIDTALSSDLNNSSDLKV